MATTSRKHPQQPTPKGTTIVKFVMKDDPSQELDVVKENLTGAGLKILKKQGYVQATKLLQEQAKKAAEKDEEKEEEKKEEEKEETSDEEEEETPDSTPETPPRTPGRARRQ